MSIFGKRLIIISFLVAVLQYSFTATAETWHLEQNQQWQSLSSANHQTKYLMAVADLKEMVNSGNTEGLPSAVAQLKHDFPEVVGPDLDAFVAAELLLANGDFVKASRSFDEFMAKYPKSGLYEAALERQFAIGTAFLGGEKKPVLKYFKLRGYAEGTKIMNRISDRAGDAPIAMRAEMAVAKSYESRGKFDDAYQQWSLTSSKWPSGRTGKEALLGMGRSKHAEYKGPSFDSSDLISAKSYYEDFSQRYSADSDKLDIAKRIEQIDEQRAYKQFCTGQYYQKTGSFAAACFYYETVIDTWPGSTAAKKAQDALNECRDQLKVKDE